MAEKLHALRGFEDLLPTQAAAHAWVEAAARDIFRRYGYSEIRTPVVEPTELFARSVGDASDVIVHKQMFTFNDPGDRSNTLRPEGTAGVVRSMIEHSVLTQAPIQKLWYIGPMFRYEKPQKGRQRQFHQVGVECFGVAGPEADAEIIALCVDLLAKLGLTDVTVKLNTLGDAADRLAYNALLREAILAKVAAARAADAERHAGWTADWERLAAINPMRVFDTKSESARGYLADMPRVSDHVGEAAREHHSRLCSMLDGQGIRYEEDPSLVRGLDYYSRTVFEVVQNNIGAQSAILGGGRYDGLVEHLGGPAVPGVGMAVGMERLLLSLEALQLIPADVKGRPDDVVVVFDEAGLAAGFALAQTGRRLGRAVVFDGVARKPKAAMREAVRSGARRALILGGNELANGTVQVKDLDAETQSEVPLAEVFA